MSASVEVTGSCLSLRAQLDSARLGLQRLERDIRRQHHNNKRFQTTDRPLERGFQGPPNNVRGGPRLGKGNFYQDAPNNRETRNFNDDRLGKKRPQETKTVFSRLSARPSGDSDVEDETNFNKKPRLSSQVIRDLPTKQEVLKAQSGDEESKARNRRMFGSLLGTLQKFKQEAIVLQNKEDKKAQVEKRIEEQAKQEKENQKKERQNLFAEREIKKATIRALEAKMVRMREFEKWELVHTTMLNFIQTKGKPHIFWKPKKMTERAEEKLNISKKNLEKIIEKKQQDVTSELNAIEQRCLRNMRLPLGSQFRPTSLASQTSIMSQDDIMDVDDQSENQENEETNDRVNNSSLTVKQEKDDSERKIVMVKSEAIQVKQEKQTNATERKIENGKSTSGERWNREESDSSSDENSVENAEEAKDHSMDESSQHVQDNASEDPGEVPADPEKQTEVEENECEVSSSAMDTDHNVEK